MKILFSSQTESLNVFFNIEKHLKKKKVITDTGYIISDSMHFHNFSIENQDFQNENLIKEWEVISRKNEKADLEIIQKYEQE